MSNKSTKKKRRNNKSTTNLGFFHYVVAIIIALLSVFAAINQGIIGQTLHKMYGIIFGRYLIIGCIYLLILSFMIGSSKIKEFFTDKKWLAFNLAYITFLLITSIIGFSLINQDLLPFMNYFQSLENGDVYGSGILGFILVKPIIFLIGNVGIFIVITILILVILFLLIDIDNFKQHLKAYQLQHESRKQDRAAKKEEQQKIKQEQKLEALAKELETQEEPKIDDSIEISEVISDETIDQLEITPIKNINEQNFDTVDQSEEIELEPLTSSDDIDAQVSVMPQKLEQQEIKTKKVGKYVIPSLSLLNDYSSNNEGFSKLEQTAKDKAKVLLQTLDTFNLKAKISKINVGPSVTKYELIPETGVKVSRFNNLHNDLAFALAAKNVRIEAPIPGKSAIGIEIPNDTNMMVGLREVLASKNNEADKKLQIGLGKDIYGDAMFCEIDKTPHLLIAGSTGSGKSVCVNSIIVSILTKALPNEVKLVMIDPKKVELTPYNGIPHLLAPVVTEAKKASIVLQKMVKEMEHRYELFSETNTRNIAGYNAKIKDEELKLPYIVIIVDELADLMMVASKEVETSIARLAQMARAAGMHLIIATQRPSTDVITGLIKANIPSRIAFAVSSGIDSRTILDQTGAEQLLGKGDMLLSEQSSPILQRIQGAFLSDDEIYKVVDFIKQQVDPADVEANYQQDLVNAEAVELDEELDPLYDEIKQYVIQTQKASASLFQRQYKVGYNRALRILDQLEANGIISANEGTKPRRVLVEVDDEY